MSPRDPFADYRREDMTIDLITMFNDCGIPFLEGSGYDGEFGTAYLTAIETVFPINSRQAASIALATAVHLSIQGGQIQRSKSTLTGIMNWLRYDTSKEEGGDKNS